MKIFVIIILSLAGLLAVTVAAASVYMFNTAVVRKKRHSTTVWDCPEVMEKITAGHSGFNPVTGERTRTLCSLGCADTAERVSVTSRDGLRLTARIIPCPEGTRRRGIMLMMHGYRSNPVFDFGGSAPVLCDMGFTLCLPDQRAHGGSEGRYLTYGVMERHDVAAWCHLLAEKFPGVPIILVGISMGASTVMGASAIELPPEVAGVIADCGYTTPAAIFKKVLNIDFKLPSIPLLPITSVMIRHLAGFDALDLSCTDAMESRRLPALIIHGTGDRFVPYSMGEELRDAAARSTLPHIFLAVDDAGHGQSFVADESAYMEAIEQLLAICKVQ